MIIPIGIAIAIGIEIETTQCRIFHPKPDTDPDSDPDPDEHGYIGDEVKTPPVAPTPLNKLENSTGFSLLVTDMDAFTADSRHGCFLTTNWSLIMAASNVDTASRQALETLCAKYWPALYGYVRRRGHSVEDARDLTQEFFLRLLERNWIARADQTKGRFRSFILTVLKRFLADEWDKVNTQKRGGNIHLESLSEVAEATYAAASTGTHSPELEFERDWALALLNNAMSDLEHEYTLGGKSDLFAVLRNYLVGGTDQRSYAAAAESLGMSEAAFKVAVCRVRQRYREKMKQEVAATVADPRDIEAEVRHLFRILAKTR